MPSMRRVVGFLVSLAVLPGVLILISAFFSHPSARGVPTHPPDMTGTDRGSPDAGGGPIVCDSCSSSLDRMARVVAEVRRCMDLDSSTARLERKHLKGEFLLFDQRRDTWLSTDHLVEDDGRGILFYVTEACPPCAEEFAVFRKNLPGIGVRSVTVILGTSDRNVARGLALDKYSASGQPITYVWDHDERIRRGLKLKGSPAVVFINGGRAVQRISGKGKIDWRNSRDVGALFSASSNSDGNGVPRACLETALAQQSPAGSKR